MLPTRGLSESWGMCSRGLRDCERIPVQLWQSPFSSPSLPQRDRHKGGCGEKPHRAVWPGYDDTSRLARGGSHPDGWDPDYGSVAFVRGLSAEARGSAPSARARAPSPSRRPPRPSAPWPALLNPLDWTFDAQYHFGHARLLCQPDQQWCCRVDERASPLDNLGFRPPQAQVGRERSKEDAEVQGPAAEKAPEVPNPP